MPLAPGARVLVGSSGAAQSGLTAIERLRRCLAQALDHGEIRQCVAAQKGLEHPVPGRCAAADHRAGVGDEASTVYARAMGVEREAFLKRFGVPMPPRKLAITSSHCSKIHDTPRVSPLAKGDTGITVLEEDAASAGRPHRPHSAERNSWRYPIRFGLSCIATALVSWVLSSMAKTWSTPSPVRSKPLTRNATSPRYGPGCSIAYNRALDLLRRRAIRATEPIEAADEIVIRECGILSKR